MPSTASIDVLPARPCRSQGFRLCFVPATDVKIIKGEDTLKTYLFNKKFLHHKSALLEIPLIGTVLTRRSHPDSVLSALPSRLPVCLFFSLPFPVCPAS